MQAQFSGNVFVYTGHINDDKKPNRIHSDRKAEKKRIRQMLPDSLKAEVKPVTDSVDVFYFLEEDDFYQGSVAKQNQKQIEKETRIKKAFTKWLTSQVIPYVELNGPELEPFRAQAFAQGLESPFVKYTQEVNALSRVIARKNSSMIRTHAQPANQAIEERMRHQREDSSTEEYQLYDLLENGLAHSPETIDELLQTLKKHCESGHYAEKLTERYGNLFLKA